MKCFMKNKYKSFMKTQANGIVKQVFVIMHISLNTQLLPLSPEIELNID